MVAKHQDSFNLCVVDNVERHLERLVAALLPLGAWVVPPGVAAVFLKEGALAGFAFLGAACLWLILEPLCGALGKRFASAVSGKPRRRP